MIKGNKGEILKQVQDTKLNQIIADSQMAEIYTIITSLVYYLDEKGVINLDDYGDFIHSDGDEIFELIKSTIFSKTKEAIETQSKEKDKNVK